MTLRQFVPAATAAVLVLVCGTLYVGGYREQYAALLTELGAAPFQSPFLDTHAVLSAVQCDRHGVDVYASNPCDVLGRIHVYSPLWLALAIFPVTTAWTPMVGIVLVAAFLVSLTQLPVARSWWQVVILAVAAVSGSTTFALERANNDLVVFVLAVLVVRLVPLRSWLHNIGYAVAVFAALLKFYPAVLLATAVRERIAVFVAVCLVAITVLAAFASVDLYNLLRVLSSVPTTFYTDPYVFAARDLPFVLAEAFHWTNGAGSLLFGLLIVAVLAFALGSNLRGDLSAATAALSELETTSLIAGCALILACFFTAQNVLYRGIHFLFVLPALTSLNGQPGDARSKRLARTGTFLILLLMEWEPIRRHINPLLRGVGLPDAYLPWVNIYVWLLRELIWWLVVTIVATVLLAVMAQSRAWLDFCDLARFCWRNARFRVQEYRMRRLILFLLGSVVTVAAAHAAPPASDPSTYCETAIASAESSVHLPARLLGAIASVESGRPDERGAIRPWPWTIDAEGRGQFFATKAEAIAAVHTLQVNGVRSIDVGCMQVNLMHHPNAFASLDEAFDPATNALYAARFLNSLYGVSGSWLQAAAAYHSETPAIGADYQRRVIARWQAPNVSAISTAYKMFAPSSAKYGDFAPMSRAYGDFSGGYAAPPRFAQR